VPAGVVFMLLDGMLEQDAPVLAFFVLARLGSIHWEDHQEDNGPKEGHGF